MKCSKGLYEIILTPYILSIPTHKVEIATRFQHLNLLQFTGATQEGNPIILSKLVPPSVHNELEKSTLKTSSDYQNFSRCLCCS